MKKLFVFLMCLSLCSFVFAQNITVKQNSFQKVALTIATENVSVEDISVPAGNFSQVSLEGYVPSNNPGAPQLPVLVKFLQIPVCESVVATVTNAQYTEYDAAQLGITHPLYPNQPSVSKSAPTPPFAYDQTVYTTDEFYALPLVSVEKTGIQRDKALATMYVSPLQYNPVTQRVRIYSQIDVEFTFVNPDMAQTQQLQKYVSPMFSMDKGLLLNEQANPFKAEFSTAPLKYLIIANSMFSGNTDLEAFATWKRRLGYKVEVAYTSDANVGTTTTSIKSYIQNQYDNATAANPAPTFVLLIGDVAQIPTFTGEADNSHKTDLYYATLSGNDYIPDCYYGRLSATSAAHLTNQLAKIMMYEQYTMPDPSYLGKAVLIAGTDGTYGPTFAQGQINYAYENYVNTTSTTHNYTTVYKHDYDCSSEASTILNEINAGAGWVNYTAHGSSSGWANPSFSTSNVSTMTNTNKYGLLIGNCCQSGTFNDSECFGEALLRAQNKGAMGYIGASNYSYWYEDVYWAVGVRSSITANMSYDANNLGMYDKLFHTKTGVPTSSWVSTIGGIMYEGNQSVQSSTSSRKQYYWEIYHCFGDPSVRIYLGMPNTMTVIADDITLGEDQYQVQAVPYAYVALKKNVTEFVAAAFANASGVATLSLPGDLEPGTLELVVLAQNYIPYFQNVEVIEEGGCLSPSGFTVSNVTPFTANLSWTGENGGVYNIERKAGNGNWTSVATGITATSYTLTGLQDNTEYQVRVQSVCGTETSSWRTVTFTTPVACPVPTDVTCTAFTTTTATLAWTENGSATTWVLQYGTNSNFTSGTYTQVTVTGNPTKTLTGLTAETTYYARVKASCGGQYGQSQWSEVATFMPSAVQTFEIGDNVTTNNTFLPSYSYYKYGFSQQIYTSDEVAVGTIKSIAFKNTGETKTRTYSIYLQQTDKEAFANTSDWETVSSTDLVFSGELTFTAGEWTVANFSTPFTYDGSSNLLVTVADVTGAYTSSPHMACLVYDATAQALYAYTDSEAYSISSPGTGNLLNVKNQIQLRIVPGEGVSCPRPKNVAASNVTANAATLSWTESGTANNWVMQYGTNENFTAGTYTEVSVTGNPTQALTGLTAETTYYARVKSVCDANDESTWSSVCTFLPSVLTVIGSGTNTNGYLPTNNYYNYSLTQQIYTPAELGAAGNIQSIAFYKNNTVECNRNMDIYMVSTTKSSFSGTTDWITVTAADKVFSGTVSFSDNTWTTITLNTPFSYDGTSNVAIIVDDNTGSYKSNTTFLAFPASSQALRIYNDGTNYDATSPSSYSGTVESTKNQIRLLIDRPEPCVAPTDLAVVELGYQSAMVSWNGEADSWTVAYKTSSASQFTEANATDNSFTLTGLAPMTGYKVKVAANCGNEIVWSNVLSFTTLPAPCPAPTNVTVSNVDRYSAVVSWTENGDATSWVVSYYADVQSLNPVYNNVEVNEPTCTLTGLMDGMSYIVRVRPVCNGVTDSWSNSVSFTTESCYMISLEDHVWTENFDDFTTSTTALTGVNPDCWQVVNEDVTLTDESRPQLYYKPNYASSGAYTLRMKNRCVYSMPVLSADIDIRTLKMTFKLRQPKVYFSLQVGVLDDQDNFYVLEEINNESTEIEDVMVDFSTYSGDARRIAFRNVLNSGVNYNYSYNYIDDIMLTDLSLCTISLPLTETFEDYTTETTAVTGVEPDCWELVQQDVAMSGATAPQLYYKSTFAHSGNYSLRMYNRGVYAMPTLDSEVEMNQVKLEMYVRQPNKCYQLHVGVWDDQTGTFEPLALVNNSTTDVTYFTCDFSDYTGAGRRIAFRNTLNGGANYNYSYNYIDDITLTVIDPSNGCNISSLPYNEDFESYTVVTTAVTGVEPDCWEMVKTYVDMPEAKQPQLYYKSAYASNGSYSLRMFNRCVYAMPELNANININDLHLSMYVRQPNKCYQLEVGVWESESGEFVPVHTFNNTTTDVTFVECDFSNYTGNGGRIAFRNSLNSGAAYVYSYNYIDEITLDYGTVARSTASEENVMDNMDVDRYLESIAVYPNPTTGVLHIDAMDVQKVECYSPMGQLVAVYDNESDLNISNLAQGVYTLRITVPQGVTVRKVVKK